MVFTYLQSLFSFLSHIFQVEYDLVNSKIDDLRLIACDRIEQSAQPLCLTWHPSITKEQFFLIANNQVGMNRQMWHLGISGISFPGNLALGRNSLQF